MNTIYIVRDGVQYGPFSETRARELIAERSLVETDLVWFAGMQAWKPASEALNTWFPAAVPKPPPLPNLTPPPLKEATASSTQPRFQTSAGQANVAAVEGSTHAANPWTKHLDAFKSEIIKNTRVDPKSVSNSLSQFFQSQQTREQPDDDASHAGEDDNDIDDDEDDRHP